MERCILHYGNNLQKEGRDTGYSGNMAKSCYTSMDKLESGVNFTFWRISEDSDKMDAKTMTFKGQNTFQELVQKQPGFN